MIETIGGTEKERSPLGKLSRAAMLAVALLATGIPGIKSPAEAQVTRTEGTDRPGLKNPIPDTFVGGRIKNPLEEARREQLRDILKKEFDGKARELESRMQELLKLGPKCGEEIDRSKLLEMPMAAQDMYELLKSLFADYYAFMVMLDEKFQPMPGIVNPRQERGDSNNSNPDDLELDVDITPEMLAKIIESTREHIRGIEEDIEEVMRSLDKEKLIKLLLKESKCEFS